jgi:hypothetical protein
MFGGSNSEQDVLVVRCGGPSDEMDVFVLWN